MTNGASGNNQPLFDPLNPTAQEMLDMLAGYREGFHGKPARDDGSLAYAHGRRNGVNDAARTTDPEQLALAAEMRRRQQAGR